MPQCLPGCTLTWSVSTTGKRSSRRAGYEFHFFFPSSSLLFVFGVDLVIFVVVVFVVVAVGSVVVVVLVWRRCWYFFFCGRSCCLGCCCYRCRRFFCGCSCSCYRGCGCSFVVAVVVFVSALVCCRLSFLGGCGGGKGSSVFAVVVHSIVVANYTPTSPNGSDRPICRQPLVPYQQQQK